PPTIAAASIAPCERWAFAAAAVVRGVAVVEHLDEGGLVDVFEFRRPDALIAVIEHVDDDARDFAVAHLVEVIRGVFDGILEGGGGAEVAALKSAADAGGFDGE